MHSARMSMGTALAAVMAMSASCGTHRLSGGNGDGGKSNAGMGSHTNPPPAAGGLGATGGSDARGARRAREAPAPG